MREGTVISLQEEKGYGFIQEQAGGPDTFFHVRDLIDLEFDGRLMFQRVRFDVITTERGLRAKNVTYTNHEELG